MDKPHTIGDWLCLGAVGLIVIGCLYGIWLIFINIIVPIALVAIGLFTLVRILGAVGAGKKGGQS